MRLDFEDSRLQLIETVRAAETQLPVAIIQSARQRLAILRAAPDLRTMKNWKSLRLKGGDPDRPQEYEVMMTERWRLRLRVQEIESAMAIVVTAIDEQLQGAA